ncbi:MAG: Flp pilus assembly protein CpaB [Cyanobacteria bacterium]|nr:Flp pilus assembly protein CpaB [Cyanobacteriota bacterium]
MSSSLRSPIKQASLGLNTERGSASGTQVSGKATAIRTVIGIAVIFLLAVGITRVVSKGPDSSVVERANIVAASQDIMPGTRLGFQHLRYLSVPTSYIQPGIFQKTNLAVGYVTKQFIAARNPIVQDSLYPLGQSLSHTLNANERAITLKLENQGLVDHNLYPDDLVDVLVTLERKGKSFSKTVCQKVRVVSAVTSAMLESRQLPSDRKNQVTLAASPDEAEVLAAAEQAGVLKLVLRNRLTTRIPVLSGVDEDDLLPEKARTEYTGQLINAEPAEDLVPPPPLPYLEPPDMATKPRDDSSAKSTSAPMSDSVRWVVEMFSGNQRSTYAIPAAGQ